jgi:glycosyltransferase involved in cell wall biosynthesis
MKAIIVSHKFNPGHLSHLLANYKLLSDAGVSVSFLWNRKFSEFSQLNIKPGIATKKDLLKLNDGDLLIVWFPSIQALLDMLVVRALKKGKIIYIFHEPFDSIRSYLASGFGVVKTIKISLISLVNYLLVLCAHKIILPSDNAFDAFTLKYRCKRYFTKIPLMFDDESLESGLGVRRQFISYIGTVAEDHAFDEFVKFVTNALGQNLFPDFKFLIATRSDIPIDSLDLLSPFINYQRLVVVSGVPLSNNEINGYYATSIIVWNAYKRSMQSGVLPKAYMFGTPVITSESNQSEFFVDGETGIEIKKGYDVDDISSAIERISIDFSRYSQHCREMFINNYYYISLSDKFLKFISPDEHEV